MSSTAFLRRGGTMCEEFRSIIGPEAMKACTLVNAALTGFASILPSTATVTLMFSTNYSITVGKLVFKLRFKVK